MKKIHAAFDEPVVERAALQKATQFPGPSLFSEIREAVYRFPSVCMVLPFNPKMDGKIPAARQLQAAVSAVQKQLSKQYPDDVCYLLSVKLRAIAGNINFNTYKQSLAIFLSPVFEKVYYLNMPVKERIWVDECFHMRALLQAKKQDQHYLLLKLDGTDSEVFRGNLHSLERLLHHTVDAAYVKTAGLLAAGAGDAKEMQPGTGSLEKRLQHTDHLLHEILAAWQLPLLVMGTKKLLSDFKQITQHAADIVSYLETDNEVHELGQVLKLLAPLVQNGDNIYQKYLQNKLEHAAAKHELYCGINDVLKAVKNRRGRLFLISEVDRDLLPGSSCSTTPPVHSGPYNTFSCISDDVDAMIETLLLNDGEVLMVDASWMRAYDHIALL